MPENGLTTAKTFPKFSGKDEDWERFCESFEATMVANTRYQKNALSLDDDTAVILKTNEVSTQTDAEKKKDEEEMRDHDLELYKILIDSIDVKHSEDAYLLVTGSKEDGYDKGCFKVAWATLKAVYEIATPQDKVTLKRDYAGLAFEHASQDPKTFVLSLDKIRGRLKKDYQVDTPLVTFLEDVVDRLPSEYKTKKEDWLKAVKDGSMKRTDLLLALAKEHKALFPESQRRDEAALVMGGGPKVKCFRCGQWGHKSNVCPVKKSDGKSKENGDWKGSSKNLKGGNKSHVRCHFCKKLGHIRTHCPRLMDKEKNEAYTHMDVVLVMDEELEMDKRDASYGVCEVNEAVGACSPCEDPLKDMMRYPCLSPIRPREYPEDEESLEVAKRVGAKTWRSNVDMSCCCKLCKKKGHEKDHCTYHCVPLKEKEECMIGIPPDDGEDVEFGSNGADQTAGVDNEVVTPRMDVENEAESPWSIHSPEAKRLKKIREEKRLGEFNEKMDQYLEERGLMLDLDRVKLNGIKPRRLTSHEEIGSRERPIEVRDLPMMPSHASLSSKKPLYRLEMRRVPSDGCGMKMNEVKEESFLRIREVFAQNIHPIQNIDAPPQY